MDNEIKISQYMQITNIEQVIKAIRELDERMDNAERAMNGLKEQIKDDSLFIDIQDLLYSVAVTFYAKGVKTGCEFESVKTI